MWKRPAIALFFCLSANCAYAQFAIPGDVDGDGDVDHTDFAITVGNYTGPIGFAGGMDWEDGDTDGDGDVDDGDRGNGFSNFTGPLAPIPISPDPYNLVYNAANGELSIVTSGNLINYVLESSTDIFLEDAALTPSNHQEFVSWLFIGGIPVGKVGTASSTPIHLGESFIDQNLPAGQYSLGFVLPSNLSEQAFINAADLRANYLTGLAEPLRAFNLVYVPIPADLDGDGDVDGVDMSGFFSNFTGPDGGPPGNPLADLDGDGDVDGVDMSGAFAAFTGPLQPVNVPEPTSLALLSFAVVFFRTRIKY